MKRRLLMIAGGVVAFALGVAVWRYFYMQQVSFPVYCSSESRFVEGNLSINARYTILFNHGSGMFSVNGVVSDGVQQGAISRQVHFNYKYSGESLTLESTQIEQLQGTDQQKHVVGRLLPSFFSTSGRFLTLAMDRDKYDNRLLTYGDLPVFYCVPRRNIDKR
ncbi:hypothetical protein [Shimwellia blattae]|uniref:Uncharacterized protein n=1 Tax=Shimwellia blattae (strain ATCC 29907 / DSM 4481 / JCM 1650 / NBRC 105725 / CDC 9005-74) TaxID=630626 RepID=I2BBD6_SHIBC|nr:hypothetical protein [Shimwellia blattae]AFJ47840.1 hypothetical protein EBL_c27690 [Shimwellia blattae DSM 4481 = NBRC 105725]GAB79589.1 hypothetical protein EB105725_01_01040 [Shimwellia blattae DSM 4481 = NBRC 105725]VDY65336.1 Uncharacterised protein [Shimwellia blattae]VEC24274.1 Uncharacterised protein [Shimwellia blattae]